MSALPPKADIQRWLAKCPLSAKNGQLISKADICSRPSNIRLSQKSRSPTGRRAFEAALDVESADTVHMQVPKTMVV